VAVRGGGRLFEKYAIAYNTKQEYTIKDIEIDTSEDIRAKLRNKPSQNILYTVVRDCLYKNLMNFDGIVLHSSAVVLDGQAYLFSGPSGIGKSTHTSLWCKYFKEEHPFILNDDMPIIRFVNNCFYAYGSPWSGKSNKNVNKKVPIRAIIFLERSNSDWIYLLNRNQSLVYLLEHVIRSDKKDYTEGLLLQIEKIMGCIPIYKMGCTISENAVNLAYTTIQRGVVSCTEIH
jgi:hypothetical protein